MPASPDPLAQIRFDNAMALFDEFVRSNVKHPDAATLRGLEGRFAARLEIQPSYWSQIKSRARQIGERLARQFEQLSHKPAGWMDQAHGTRLAAKAATAAAAKAATVPANGGGAGSRVVAGKASTPAPASASESESDDSHPLPRDDDERFIMGLVLTFYRRHPQRARARLLELLGEALAPPAAVPPAAATAGRPSAKRPAVAPPAVAQPVDDAQALWARTRAAVGAAETKALSHAPPSDFRHVDDGKCLRLIRLCLSFAQVDEAGHPDGLPHRPHGGRRRRALPFPASLTPFPPCRCRCRCRSCCRRPCVQRWRPKTCRPGRRRSARPCRGDSSPRPGRVIATGPFRFRHRLPAPLPWPRSPTPETSMTLTLRTPKPRNPLVALARSRRAGSHRPATGARRQAGARQLRETLRQELPQGRPPTPIP